MKVIHLDLSGVESISDLHDCFEEAFSLPPWYGRNLDALWDCLSDGFTEPTLLQVTDLPVLQARLGSVANVLVRLFRDLSDCRENLIVDIDGLIL